MVPGRLSCRGERFHATGKTSADGAAVAIGSRGHFAVRVEGWKVVDVWSLGVPCSKPIHHRRDPALIRGSTQRRAITQQFV
jgi:hypothetical protein